VWVHQILDTLKQKFSHMHTPTLVLMLLEAPMKPATWTPLVRKTFVTRSRLNPCRTTSLIPLLGHQGSREGPPISGKRSHKWESHHTFTQNLKTMGLWVLPLIICSTSTFLTDVRLLTPTCYIITWGEVVRSVIQVGKCNLITRQMEGNWFKKIRQVTLPSSTPIINLVLKNWPSSPIQFRNKGC